MSSCCALPSHCFILKRLVWDASVCLMRQFFWPVGLVWEDGSRRDGEPHVAFPCCLCVFIWETLQLSYLKIASALRLGLSSPPIFIFVLSVLSPDTRTSPLPLRAVFRPSSSSRDTRNLIPSSSQLASPVQKEQRLSYLHRYPGSSHGRVVPSAHQWRLKVKIWKLLFFSHFESLSIFHFCW